MKYCKICGHNFNSGETFAHVGKELICANCAFTTTVFDLIKRGIIESETLDENAINADFVVVDSDIEKSGHVTRSESDVDASFEYTDENSNVRHLEKRDPMPEFDKNQEFAALFTDVSGRKRYFIFPDTTAFEKESVAMYNLRDIHFCALDEIPSEYTLDLDFRDTK